MFHNAKFQLVALLLTATTASLAVRPAAAQSSPETTAAGSVRLPISLESNMRTELQARIEAFVGSVHVDIGDRVKAGQELVTLEAPLLESEVRRRKEMLAQSEAQVKLATSAVKTAQAQMAQAQAARREQDAMMQLRTSERDRYMQLVAGGAVQQRKADEANYAVLVVEAASASADADITAAEADIQAAESQVAFAQTGVEVAQADFNHAEAEYEFRSIRAPFDGIISARNVDPGALVSRSKDSRPLLVVENIDVIRGVMSLPIAEASQIRVGSTVTFTSLGDAPITSPDGSQAHVSRLGQSLDMKTRTMRVEIDIANPFDATTGRYQFLSGQYGSAAIATGK